MAFYVGYLVCEIPNGYMIQKFPIAKYLGLWSKSPEYPRFSYDDHKTLINSDARSRSLGVCMTLNCVSTNYASLLALRDLLGCFESVSLQGK